MKNALGTHIILDFCECNPDTMKYVADVQSIIKQSADLAKFTVVAEEYHQFEPHGVSGMTIIAESHISLHSWSEHCYIAVDIFYCGENNNVENGINSLVEAFQPKRIVRNHIPRGIVPQEIFIN